MDYPSIVETLTDNITPYQYVSLRNAISHLSPTGKALIKIILNSPEGIYDWTASEVGVKSHHLKAYLREIGWGERKINFGFKSIKKMLDEI